MWKKKSVLGKTSFIFHTLWKNPPLFPQTFPQAKNPEKPVAIALDRVFHNFHRPYYYY
jgi:hypothetical protein